MKKVQILKEIEEIRNRISQNVILIREIVENKDQSLENLPSLHKECDKLREELEKKVLETLSEWGLGKNGHIYGAWEKGLSEERNNNPLMLGGEGAMRVKKGFLNEIKESPQDWDIEQEESADSYYDMLVIKHKTGRKHYQPKQHNLWGFSHEEWTEIEEFLNNQQQEMPQKTPEIPSWK